MLPESKLVKKQKRICDPVVRKGQLIVPTVRWDDDCGNGHNSFSVTGHIYERKLAPGEATTIYEGKTWWMCGGGCIHDEIERYFPELRHLIKWHLVSSDGPMHYLSNTIYNAGERDHWGLLKGEFRQHKSRGPHQADGVEGVPHWEIRMPKDFKNYVYSNEKPPPVVAEYRPSGLTGEGKERNLDHARSSACWPEATDEQLCLPKEELAKLLIERLPALMQQFYKDITDFGFTY